MKLGMAKICGLTDLGTPGGDLLKLITGSRGRGTPLDQAKQNGHTAQEGQGQGPGIGK